MRAEVWDWSHVAHHRTFAPSKQALPSFSLFTFHSHHPYSLSSPPFFGLSTHLCHSEFHGAQQVSATGARAAFHFPFRLPPDRGLPWASGTRAKSPDKSHVNPLIRTKRNDTRHGKGERVNLPARFQNHWQNALKGQSVRNPPPPTAFKSPRLSSERYCN